MSKGAEELGYAETAGINNKLDLIIRLSEGIVRSEDIYEGY